ncbi:MAG TPA: VWA domain-containing protein [Pyrinomonadaceae bacterium]
MKKNPSLALILLVSLFIQVTAQNSAPAPQQEQSEEDEVVRITTNLVQVDAVVTDKDGNQVTDLTVDDFEVLEDGDRQQITNFSYVAPESMTTPSEAAAPAGKVAPAVVPTRLRPEQVKRTMALVADDLALTVATTNYLRLALKKTVAEQLQPGDLAAVIRTAGGVGYLQQFTTNKQLLYAAIERIRRSVFSRVNSFDGITAAPIAKFGDGMIRAGGGQAPNMLGEDKVAKMAAQLNLLRDDVFTFNTINSLNYVINGLRKLPGRKSILLFSDSIKLTERNLDEMRRLADNANRASVVIYAMDTRGLPVTGLMAADATSGNTGPEIDAKLAERAAAIPAGQSGLFFLTEQTGGLFVRNTNDLSGGIKRILDDQKGYYLLGYRPDKSTFDKNGSRRFHNIQIKVKRPGLSVRFRRGFYGLAEENKPAAPRTRSQELLDAMLSPFYSGGIDMRLTSLFSNEQGTGSFMRTLLHVDAKALKFTESPDGWQTAKMEVAALTMDALGKIVDQVTREETIQARGASYQRLLRNGLVYAFDVPVRKPGAYQLRVAVRDPSSKLIGSASQFIEVPDLKTKRLALSGIYARGVNPAEEAPAIKSSWLSGAGGLLSKPPEIAEGSGQETGVQPGAAVRRLRRGMALDYGFYIFNPQVDERTRRPLLQTQLILLRDGQQVLAKNVQASDAGNKSDPNRLDASGRLELGADLPPGQYVLQVVVTDLLADEKHRTATQAIDFEIVK